MNRSIPKFLSIIVPVYKQERTIEHNLRAIISELESFTIPYEVIVVIDGTGDNSMREAKKIHSSKVHVIGYETNRGKGYAVRFGMAKSKGDIIGFIDAGGEIRETGIQMLIEHMRWYDADIIIGSKRHPVSKVSYPIDRKIMSFMYQLVIRLLFGINVRDTQVGLKLFKRKVLEDVLPRLLVKQFAFDIEILSVANYLGYSRIYESPVELDFSKYSSTISKGKIISVVLKMIRDTLAIYYRLRIRHYYDTGNIREWRFDPELNFRVNVG